MEDDHKNVIIDIIYLVSDEEADRSEYVTRIVKKGEKIGV